MSRELIGFSDGCAIATDRAANRTAESFQGLLLRHRGRTRLTQRQLAARVGVSRRSIQDWEAGLNHPAAERLQALMVAFLEAGGLTLGAEATEAEALWAAALRQAPRMRTPFDEQWFAPLLTRGDPRPETDLVKRAEDWGDAPDAMGLVGRADELALLGHWVLEERCRLVALVGMGGIGKTSLAASLAHDVSPSFERL